MFSAKMNAMKEYFIDDIEKQLITPLKKAKKSVKLIKSNLTLVVNCDDCNLPFSQVSPKNPAGHAQ